MKTLKISTAAGRSKAQEAVYDLDLAYQWKVEITKISGSRTLTQNKAMHKYFELLAKALNDAGLDMKRVLKEEVEIPFTKESVKEHLWRPVQKVMLMKDSTTEITTAEPSDVYLVLSRHLSEKYGINVDWPSYERG